MPTVTCWCGKYKLRPADMTYVSDGIPCCGLTCYTAAENAYKARRELVARLPEYATITHPPFLDRANEMED